MLPVTLFQRIYAFKPPQEEDGEGGYQNEGFISEYVLNTFSVQCFASLYFIHRLNKAAASRPPSIALTVITPMVMYAIIPPAVQYLRTRPRFTFGVEEVGFTLGSRFNDTNRARTMFRGIHKHQLPEELPTEVSPWIMVHRPKTYVTRGVNQNLNIERAIFQPLNGSTFLFCFLALPWTMRFGMTFLLSGLTTVVQMWMLNMVKGEWFFVDGYYKYLIDKDE